MSHTRRASIKQALKDETYVIPGYEIAYPVVQLGEGAYGAVFIDGNESVIRVSEKAVDHQVNLLANKVWFLPRSDISYVDDGVCVSVRDDIPDLYHDTVRSLEASVGDLDISLYPTKELQRNRLNGHGYTFVGAVSNLVFGMPDVDVVRTLFSGFLKLADKLTDYYEEDNVITADDFRCELCRLYDDVMEPIRDEIGGANVYLCKPNHNSFLMENGTLSVFSNQHGKVRCVFEPFLSMAEIVVQHPEYWDDQRRFLRMCVNFMDEFGVLPYDLHSRNLGEYKGDIIFRDPYWFASKFDDYQIRVGQHRRRMGLPIPEEWNIHPHKMDVASILLRVDDNPITRELMLPYEVNKTTYSENSVYSGDIIITMRLPETGMVLDAIKDDVPLSGGRMMFTPTRDDVAQALSIMQYTETNPDSVEALSSYIQVYSDDNNFREYLKMMADENDLSVIHYFQKAIDNMNLIVTDGLPTEVIDDFFALAKHKKNYSINDRKNILPTGDLMDRLKEYEAMMPKATVITRLNLKSRVEYLQQFLGIAQSIETETKYPLFSSSLDVMERFYKSTGVQIGTITQLCIEEDTVKLGYYKLPDNKKLRDVIFDNVAIHNTPVFRP